MNTLLQHLDNALLLLFGLGALASAASMLVLRQAMRVAMALITTMLFLGAIYGLLGVHFIAAFQVLIYVGAVMVFMVYVIMLLDVREDAHPRYAVLLWPGVAGAVVLLGTLGASVLHSGASVAVGAGSAGAVGAKTVGAFSIQQFAASFLGEYWLHFELTSVLLLAAVVAALAVIRVSRRRPRSAGHG